MKKVIKQAQPEEAKYICDLCQKGIENDEYGLDRVDIVTRVSHGNGWVGIDRIEQKVFHAHRKCLQTAIDLMGGNSSEI